MCQYTRYGGFYINEKKDVLRISQTDAPNVYSDTYILFPEGDVLWRGVYGYGGELGSELAIDGMAYFIDDKEVTENDYNYQVNMYGEFNDISDKFTMYEGDSLSDAYKNMTGKDIVLR